ncbi:MAG: LysE family translocator [Rhizobiaceae bacterium]
MVAFTLAVFFLIITPGPGVLSAAGVGAGFGFRAGLSYVAGLFVGNNLVALAVVSGLAALLFSLPYVRTVLFAVSLAYLFYLAAKIAFAGSKLAFIHSERPPGFIGGLALQPINPKAYVVNTTFFTGFPFWADNLVGEILVKFLIMNLIWTPIHLLWLFAGVSLHRLDLSKKAHLTINIGMAVSMLLVVIIAALATLRG